MTNEPTNPPRAVFFVSDRTGITAETLGNMLLTQFESIEFTPATIPFITTPARAEQACQRINKSFDDTGIRPLVFSTVIDDGIRAVLAQARAKLFDFVDVFVHPLEEELHTSSAHVAGKAHGKSGSEGYKTRIDAVHFALEADDGAITRNYDHADVILTGVSRAGKTPTCLYLAMNYGVYAANYPITEEDLDGSDLPKVLQQHRDKLVALTIEPARLQEIRQERRADSRYASMAQCRQEVRAAEQLFKGERLLILNSTRMSIEEMATRIMHEAKLSRRFF